LHSLCASVSDPQLLEPCTLVDALVAKVSSSLAIVLASHVGFPNVTELVFNVSFLIKVVSVGLTFLSFFDKIMNGALQVFALS